MPQVPAWCGHLHDFHGAGRLTCRLGTLSPARLKNASGLFNLMRNLGGAVGLALINTLLNKRLDLHLARLHENVSWGRPSLRTRCRT